MVQKWPSTLKNPQRHLSFQRRSVATSPKPKRILIQYQESFFDPIIWVCAVTLIRASILTLYIRLFPSRTFRFVCYAILLFNAAFCFGTILYDCLICRPISFRWDRSIANGRCGAQQSLDLFIATVNCFLDIIVVATPMPILWRLQMTVGKKVMLSVMFGMGNG